jgi:hypothetical protein
MPRPAAPVAHLRVGCFGGRLGPGLHPASRLSSLPLTAEPVPKHFGRANGGRRINRPPPPQWAALVPRLHPANRPRAHPPSTWPKCREAATCGRAPAGLVSPDGTTAQLSRCTRFTRGGWWSLRMPPGRSSTPATPIALTLFAHSLAQGDAHVIPEAPSTALPAMLALWGPPGRRRRAPAGGVALGGSSPSPAGRGARWPGVVQLRGTKRQGGSMRRSMQQRHRWARPRMPRSAAPAGAAARVWRGRWWGRAAAGPHRHGRRRDALGGARRSHGLRHPGAPGGGGVESVGGMVCAQMKDEGSWWAKGVGMAVHVLTAPLCRRCSPQTPCGTTRSSASGGHGRGGPAALHQSGRQRGAGAGGGGTVQLLGRTASGAIVVPFAGRMAFTKQVRTGEVQRF